MVTIIRKIRVMSYPEHSEYVEPILRKFDVDYTSHFDHTTFEGHDIFRRFFKGTVAETKLGVLIAELDALPISVTIQY